MSIAASELILNPNGSIYHLHLKPEVASTVITVGDPDRVELVSCLFLTPSKCAPNTGSSKPIQERFAASDLLLFLPG